SQALWYGKEVQASQKRQPLPVRSDLRLCPMFIDKDGLVRLKSRLERTEHLDFDRKCPIVLSSDCGLTWALAVDAHQGMGHMQESTTLGELRRVDPHKRPFTYVGVDLFGPVHIKVNPPDKYDGLIVS